MKKLSIASPASFDFVDYYQIYCENIMKDFRLGFAFSLLPFAFRNFRFHCFFVYFYCVQRFPTGL